MSIEKINSDLCNGCGICVESCPMDVIRIDNKTKKAVIQYPQDCMLCGWCTTDCPQDAIYVSLDKHPSVTVTWG